MNAYMIRGRSLWTPHFAARPSRICCIVAPNASRDVRVESAMRTKVDIAGLLRGGTGRTAVNSGRAVCQSQKLLLRSNCNFRSCDIG
jgi:hypothetical protein